MVTQIRERAENYSIDELYQQFNTVTLGNQDLSLDSANLYRAIERVQEIAQKEGKPLVINGDRGSGKTLLSMKYFADSVGSFDHIVFGENGKLEIIHHSGTGNRLRRDLAPSEIPGLEADAYIFDDFHYMFDAAFTGEFPIETAYEVMIHGLQKATTAPTIMITDTHLAAFAHMSDTNTSALHNVARELGFRMPWTNKSEGLANFLVDERLKVDHFDRVSPYQLQLVADVLADNLDRGHGLTETLLELTKDFDLKPREFMSAANFYLENQIGDTLDLLNFAQDRLNETDFQEATELPDKIVSLFNALLNEIKITGRTGFRVGDYIPRGIAIINRQRDDRFVNILGTGEKYDIEGFTNREDFAERFKVSYQTILAEELEKNKQIIEEKLEDKRNLKKILDNFHSIRPYSKELERILSWREFKDMESSVRLPLAKKRLREWGQEEPAGYDRVRYGMGGTYEARKERLQKDHRKASKEISSARQMNAKIRGTTQVEIDELAGLIYDATLEEVIMDQYKQFKKYNKLLGPGENGTSLQSSLFTYTITAKDALRFILFEIFADKESLLE